MAEHANLRTEIRDFIFRTFPAAAPRKISDSDSLFTTGIIDSLGVLELVTFLESTYQLTFDDEDIVGGSFESIASLAGLVAEKQQSQVQA